MQVQLPPELEDFVRRQIATGEYESAVDVVRQALRLLETYDELNRRRLEDLNRKIDEGLAQLDRGAGIPGDESHRRSKAKLAGHTSTPS
jgi:antitoxin ParD1/3/4